MSDSIKSVEFRIKASGFGVVNWNGPKTGGDYNNHLEPKIRTSGQDDSQWVFISSNCWRHHIFKDDAEALFKTHNTPRRAIGTFAGLVRGYLFTGRDSTPIARKSALLSEDWTEHNFNVCHGDVRSSKLAVTENGDRDSNSFYHLDTLGETYYTGYCALNIEDLQFITLTHEFGDSDLFSGSVPSENTSKDEEDARDNITNLVQTLNERLFQGVKSPQAEIGYYRRKNSLYNVTRRGIKLNDDAVELLVEEFYRRLSTLAFSQGKGYVGVESVDVHYNTDHQPMKIRRSGDGAGLIHDRGNMAFESFYEKVGDGEQ